MAELRGPDGPLTMAATAGVLGGLCGVELALFGWLGRAAPSRPSPGEVVWASAASLRAAWRASELESAACPSRSDWRPPTGAAHRAPAVAAGLALLAAGAAVDQAVPEAALGVVTTSCSRRIVSGSSAGRLRLTVPSLGCSSGSRPIWKPSDPWRGGLRKHLVGTLDSTVTLSPGHTAVQVRGLNPGGRA